MPPPYRFRFVCPFCQNPHDFTVDGDGIGSGECEATGKTLLIQVDLEDIEDDDVPPKVH